MKAERGTFACALKKRTNHWSGSTVFASSVRAELERRHPDFAVEFFQRFTKKTQLQKIFDVLKGMSQPPPHSVDRGETKPPCPVPRKHEASMRQVVPVLSLCASLCLLFSTTVGALGIAVYSRYALCCRSVGKEVEFNPFGLVCRVTFPTLGNTSGISLLDVLTCS